MKIVIVEDEAIAARNLARLLSKAAPDFEVVAVLPSVEASVRWLREHPAPDALFLDVQLADGLSFEIFDAVEIDAPVVFTTAYDQYALRAFEVAGVDYLLKPIEPARLATAIERLRGRAAPPPLARLAREYGEATRQYKSRFLVHSGETLHSIEVERIAYFVKELVVRLVTVEGRGHALSQSLDDLENLLDPTRFFRLNRQVLASIDAIDKAHRGFKGKLEVTLKPATAEPVTVSQERAAAFRAWLDR